MCQYACAWREVLANWVPCRARVSKSKAAAVHSACRRASRAPDRRRALPLYPASKGSGSSHHASLPKREVGEMHWARPKLGAMHSQSAGYVRRFYVHRHCRHLKTFASCLMLTLICIKGSTLLHQHARSQMPLMAIMSLIGGECLRR